MPHPVDDAVITVALAGAETALGDHLKDVLQGLVRQDRVAGVFDVLAPFLHLIRRQAEKEEVFRPDLFPDLHIGAVQRPDGQRAVQRQFHVAGARRLFPGGGNLFRQVCRRDQVFGHRDVVIGRIDHLQQIARPGVIVDGGGHIIDKVDDFLGHDIARRGLAAEDLHPRHMRQVRVLADEMPLRDGLKDVEKLALVFVQPLDLHVEHRVRADADAGRPGDPVGRRHLVGALGGGEGIAKALVLHMRLKPRQPVEVILPPVPDRFGDQPRQRRVRHAQPAAGGDAVRLIHDPAGVELVQLGKQPFLDQFGMQSGDAVDAVGGDEGQFAHPHLVMLHDADVMGAVGEAAAVQAVDAFDDLHVARQDVADQPGGPAFQRLGQKGVVGVAKAGLRNVERLLKPDPVGIGQKPDQFRPGQRRMGVVHLDRDMGRQRRQVGMRFQIAAQNVLDRGGGQEKLLLQAQFLALIGRILGVEHPADGPRQRLRLCRRGVVAAVETLKVEGLGGLRAPQPQRIGPAPLPAHHRRVIGRGDHGFARRPERTAVLFDDLALEADRVGAFGPLEFPRVAGFQPVLGRLDLLAAFETLAEKAVFVADAIAVGRAADRRHAFHVAGGKTAQPAIAQRRVRLLPRQRREVLPQIGQNLLRHVAQAEVDRGILKDAADQEFHRQVIDTLAVLGPGAAGGGEPRPHDPVADRKRQRHAPVVIRGMARILAKRIGQMAQDIGAKRLLAGPLGGCVFHVMAPSGAGPGRP